jgi:hypothetical protein
VKKLIAALAVLAVTAPSALAASHFLKVSPGITAPAAKVKVSGSVGRSGGCEIGHKGDSAVVFSKAFKGATKHNFAGVPSVSVDLSKNKTGAFSFKITLSQKLKAGKYTISGRCGGGKFGQATLRVEQAGLY